MREEAPGFQECIKKAANVLVPPWPLKAFNFLYLCFLAGFVGSWGKCLGPMGSWSIWNEEMPKKPCLFFFSLPMDYWEIFLMDGRKERREGRREEGREGERKEKKSKGKERRYIFHLHNLFIFFFVFGLFVFSFFFFFLSFFFFLGLIAIRTFSLGSLTFCLSLFQFESSRDGSLPPGVCQMLVSDHVPLCN